MNDKVIESFIEFCDDMKIAEESVHEMNAEMKIFEKKLKLLKVQFMKADGNINEQCKILDQMNNELKKIKNIINKLEPSMFDKGARGIRNVVSGVLFILSLIAAIPTFGLTLFATFKSAELLVDHDIDNVKIKLLTILDNYSNDINTLKKHLKEDDIANEGMISRMKENHKINKDMRKAGYGGIRGKKRFKEDYKKADKYISKMKKLQQNKEYDQWKKEHVEDLRFLQKIANEIKEETTKWLSNNRISTKTILDKRDETEYLIYVDDKELDNLVENGNYSGKDESDFYNKISNGLNDITEQIESKYAEELDKYDIGLRYDNPDDIYACTIYIE